MTGESTDGTLQVWAQEADTGAMFVARMIRLARRTAPKASPVEA